VGTLTELLVEKVAVFGVGPSEGAVTLMFEEAMVVPAVVQPALSNQKRTVQVAVPVDEL
jgi:hypothetical protein